MIVPLKCPKKHCKSKKFYADLCTDDLRGIVQDIQFVCVECGASFFMKPRAILDLALGVKDMSTLRREILEEIGKN